MQTKDVVIVSACRTQGTLRCNGEELAVQAGESVFVPAIDSIVDAEGQMTLILSHV